MAANHIELLEKLLRILKEENVFDTSGEYSVMHSTRPVRLKEQLMSFSLKDEPESDEEIETAIRNIVKYSVKTCSPYFRHEIYAGIDKYGLIGACLTEILNVSPNNFKIAPVFTMIEDKLIDMSLKITGLSDRPRGDGIITPNRDMSNMYAMLLARHCALSAIREEGVRASPTLACFTSEYGHDSILHVAHILGIGMANVYKIKTDLYGRMKIRCLTRAIGKAHKKGQIPFFVNATAGTVAFGAVDPLMNISYICWKKKIWLHVDACLGGTLLFSKKLRKELNGIEYSNSVTWNPHEMFGAPSQCSVFIIENKFPSSTEHHADLMSEADIHGIEKVGSDEIQPDRLYDMTLEFPPNQECSRKADAMKFWLMWKAHGTIGLQRLVTQAFLCAEYFYRRIRENPNFRLLMPISQCRNICFWYIPSSMRNKEQSEDWWMDLYKATTALKKRLIRNESVMINLASLADKKYSRFFCMIVHCQPPPDESFMDNIISRIEEIGSNM